MIESNGNLDGTIEVHRKLGLTTTNKKMGHTTSEGLLNVYVTPDQRIGAMIIEVNGDTDFGSKKSTLFF
ncbi:hypothetical protein [Bacillus sp. FJAT-49736]|uniref:hypothetical protein n=1 Tax=Bacillus sp. FJAT-49736 TaxID=2833582 RepID=UPI001BCA2896|nr:hypothetical protein [Bacillus sp. FJAT-49736]MBS4172237.1 hypothetical protein [Bacillus sp. FJAT-49736]